jgi:hypothetical protein
MLAVPPLPGSGRVVCGSEVGTGDTTAAAKVGARGGCHAGLLSVRVGFPAVRTGGLCGSGLRATGPVERECKKDRPLELEWV